MSRFEDEAALRNLMATYVDAVNRRDGKQWQSTWAEDGRWLIMGMEIVGRDNIFGLWSQVMETFEFALLYPTSGCFEIDGDTATGHWHVQEYTRNTAGERGMVLGRYQDTYRRCDGQWLYQSRDYHMLYTGAPDLSGDYVPLPDPA